MDNNEYTGLWWSVDSPDNKHYGTLKINIDEGFALNIPMSSKTIVDQNALFNSNIILGLTNGDKLITLLDFFEYSATETISNSSNINYIGNLVIIGNHYHNKEEILIDNISFYHSHIEDWLRINNFEMIRELDENHKFKKLSVGYMFPKINEFNINENFKLSFDYNFHFNHEIAKSAFLEQKTYIKIKSINPIKFDIFLQNILKTIVDFFSFTIGQSLNSPIYIKSKLNDQSNDEINIYSYQYFNNWHEKFRRYNVLIDYIGISSNFESYLKNWVLKYELYKPVFILYFGVMHNSSIYLEHEFLSLVQALEAYHRLKYDQCAKYVNDLNFKDIYETFVNAIPTNLEKDFKTCLKEKFKYLNEYSLRKRIKELTSQQNIMSFITDNIEEFIKSVLTTRNYLTHYEKNIEKDACSGYDLSILVNKIKILLEIHIMKEINIQDEDVIKYIRKKHQLR